MKSLILIIVLWASVAGAQTYGDAFNAALTPEERKYRAERTEIGPSMGWWEGSAEWIRLPTGRWAQTASVYGPYGPSSWEKPASSIWQVRTIYLTEVEKYTREGWEIVWEWEPAKYDQIYIRRRVP